MKPHTAPLSQDRIALSAKLDSGKQIGTLSIDPNGSLMVLKQFAAATANPNNTQSIILQHILPRMIEYVDLVNFVYPVDLVVLIVYWTPGARPTAVIPSAPHRHARRPSRKDLLKNFSPRVHHRRANSVLAFDFGEEAFAIPTTAAAKVSLDNGRWRSSRQPRQRLSRSRES